MSLCSSTQHRTHTYRHSYYTTLAYCSQTPVHTLSHTPAPTPANKVFRHSSAPYGYGNYTRARAPSRHTPAGTRDGRSNAADGKWVGVGCRWEDRTESILCSGSSSVVVCVPQGKYDLGVGHTSVTLHTHTHTYSIHSYN